MGSPAVSVERLANDETEQAVLDLMEYLGHKKIDAFMDLEIGGANGLQALALGSTKNHGCPVVDADFMGMSVLMSTCAATKKGTQAETYNYYSRPRLSNILADHHLYLREESPSAMCSRLWGRKDNPHDQDHQ